MIELNNGQKKLKEEFMKWYRDKNRSQIFDFCGEAGTGKSTMGAVLLEEAGFNPRRVATLTYTGKAAVNLIKKGVPYAQTIHSLLYTPIEKKVPLLNKDGNPKLDKNGKERYAKKLTWQKRDTKEILNNYDLIYIDEGYMIGKKEGKDLEDIGLPMLISGDIEQLGPVKSKPYFLSNPKFKLEDPVRQALDNPILQLARDILKYGTPQKKVYSDKVRVYVKPDEYFMEEAFAKLMKLCDITLVGTNNTRVLLNNLYREYILGYTDVFPQVGDKIICRWNNKNIVENSAIPSLPLVNGLMGYITEPVKTIDKIYGKINFSEETDATRIFKNLYIDLNYLFDKTLKRENKTIYGMPVNFFQYAYCITTHLSQGSEWDKCIYIDDWKYGNNKRIRYTAVTRAKKNLIYFI